MKKLLLTIAIATLTTASHAQDILFADDGLANIVNINTSTSGGDVVSTTNTVIGLRRVNSNITIRELAGANEEFIIVYKKLIETSGVDEEDNPVLLTNGVGKIISRPLGNEAGADTPDVLQYLKEDTGWDTPTAVANYAALKTAITKAARAKARQMIQAGD